MTRNWRGVSATKAPAWDGSQLTAHSSRLTIRHSRFTVHNMNDTHNHLPLNATPEHRRQWKFTRAKTAAIAVVLAAACCIGATASLADPAPKNVAADAPLSEFIIGRWGYRGLAFFKGYGNQQVYWEYTFRDTRYHDPAQPGLEINMWWDSGDKLLGMYTGDGETCAYRFSGPDVLTVDCPRSITVSTLSVKRHGQDLLLQWLDRGDGTVGETFRFIRCRRLLAPFFACG